MKSGSWRSKVFEWAYHSNDILLIFAPTGAGKTNVTIRAKARAMWRAIIKSIKPMQQLTDIDIVCYDKRIDFVHARNGMVRTANVLHEMAVQRQQLTLFAPDESKDLGLAKHSMANTRNKQLNELFQYGIAMHHAGMLRTDRNTKNILPKIKVLVCTATLAWGLNLPAHAVIIKGT